MGKGHGGRIVATLYSYVGNVGNALVLALQGVILIPLCLHYIPLKLYGAWIATGEILVLLQVFDLGIPSLMIQKIGTAYGQGDERKAGEWMGTSFLVLTLIAFVVAFLGGGVAHMLLSLLHVDPIYQVHFRNALLLSMVATAGLIINFAFIGCSQGIQRTGLVSFTAILASIFGFLTSVVLMRMGFKLYSLAFGYVVRSVVLLIGGGYFYFFQVPKSIREHVGFSTKVLQEFFRILPVTALGGICFVGLSQGEMLMISVFLRPELAPILLVTRKVAELSRALVDMLAMASYGSFSSLLGSGDFIKANDIYSRLYSSRNIISFIMLSTYILVNGRLVSQWVGPELYGGSILTLFIAAQFFIVGQGFFLNLLYRATGKVASGAALYIVELMLRVPLAYLFIKLFGLLGVPLAAILTSIPMLFVLRRQINLTGMLKVELWKPSGWTSLILLIGLTFLAFLLNPRIPLHGWVGIFIGIMVWGGGLMLLAGYLSLDLRRMMNFILKRQAASC